VFLGFLGWSFLSGLSVYVTAPPGARPYVHALLAANFGMIGLSMGIEAFYQRHWWLCFALIAATRLAARSAFARQPGMEGTRSVQTAWLPGFRPAMAQSARFKP
jgi:hypothetical protein